MALSLLSCSEGAVMMPESPEPKTVPIGFEGRTTDGAIALINLNSEVETFERLQQATPNEIFLASWVSALLQRSAFTGSYDDFLTADAITEADVTANPDAAAAHLTRAAVLSAVHEFRAALDELDVAERLGASPSPVERARLIIEVSLGMSSPTLETRAMQLVTTNPSFQNRNTLATVLASLGKFEQADSTYREALASERDLSVFSVAWSMFVRGVMWAEMANRPDLARPLYEEAVRRLPGYVVANVHLSEQEAEAGQPELAIARLERLVGVTGDPEPAGALAELIVNSEPARASELAEQGAARYHTLLARHRPAFLDHGSEFFAGPGNDPAMALVLALENLERRPNARAFQVAIEAALAAEDLETACSLAERARPLTAQNPTLADVVGSLGLICPE